jgi:hypothetical protein
MAEGELRLSDLVALGDCPVCGGRQLAGSPGLSSPLFYVVEVTRMGFDRAALQRSLGQELAMGPLAQVLGSDEPLARKIDGPHRVFVHEECAGDVGHLMRLMGAS